jgi:hypothetical protein
MTSARLCLTLIGLLVFVLPACSRAGSEPSSPPEPAGARVVVTRSGGIAGVNDTIILEPAGQWTRIDRAGERHSGQLTDAQRARLTALATDPGLIGESAPPAASTRCRDAFHYALTVGSIRVSYVDCPADGALPVTAMSLVDLVTEATR